MKLKQRSRSQKIKQRISQTVSIFYPTIIWKTVKMKSGRRKMKSFRFVYAIKCGAHSKYFLIVPSVKTTCDSFYCKLNIAKPSLYWTLIIVIKISVASVNFKDLKTIQGNKRQMCISERTCWIIRNCFCVVINDFSFVWKKARAFHMNSSKREIWQEK